MIKHSSAAALSCHVCAADGVRPRKFWCNLVDSTNVFRIVFGTNWRLSEFECLTFNCPKAQVDPNEWGFPMYKHIPVIAELWKIPGITGIRCRQYNLAIDCFRDGFFNEKEIMAQAIKVMSTWYDAVHVPEPGVIPAKR